MAFNKSNKKIVTTALTAAMVASAVAPVAAAKVTPQQDATNKVNAYLKVTLKTSADAKKADVVKKAALDAVKKLTSKADAKLKTSLTGKINAKSASLSKDLAKIVAAEKAKAAAADKVNVAAADKAVKAFTALPTVKTEAEWTNSLKLKDAALKAISVLADAKLKASYTSTVNAKNTEQGNAINQVRAVDAATKAVDTFVKFEIKELKDGDQAKSLKDAATTAIAKVTDKTTADKLTASVNDQDKKNQDKLATLDVPTVSGVTAIDVNKVQVKFDKAVDTSKVTVALKVGAASLYTTTAFSDDKKSVVLTTPSAIASGDYSVVVSGINKDGTDAVSPLHIDTAVAKDLTISNTQAAISNASVVSFSVKNQYGTDMGVLGNDTTNLTVSAYDVTANQTVNVVASPNAATKSEVALDLSGGSVKVGDTVRIIANYKGVTVTKNVTVVAASAAADVTLGSVAPLANTARITAGDTSLTLPYTLKDQYGNDVKLTLGDTPNVTFLSSDKTVVNPSTLSVDGSGKLTFNAGAAGTATITAIINATGKVATTTVTVNAAGALKNVTVGAPSGLISAGQTVNLDLTGADQYGGSVTDFSGVTPTSDNAAVTPSIVNGKLQLVTSGATGGTANITLKNAGGTVLGTTTIKFENKAVPTAIVGVDTLTGIESGASEDITWANFKVKDQFGRDYALAASDTVTVAPVDGTFDTVTKADGTNKFTFTASGTAGTEAVKFTLANGASYNVNLASVATSSISSYTVQSVGTLVAQPSLPAAGFTASDYNVQLKLDGKLADGTKVYLSSTKITNATSSNEAVATVIPSGVVTGNSKGTTTITLWNGATKLADVTVTVNDASPVATTVAFDESTPFTVTHTAGSGDTMNLSTKLTVSDQYGVKLQAPKGFYATSDATIADVNGTTGVVTGKKAGKVTITYITSNGITKTTTVTVN